MSSGSGLSIVCFASSYACALLLEVVGLKADFRLRRVLAVFCALAGLVAHTWYLGIRAAAAPEAPLASAYDWCLLAAWALAVVYLWLAFYAPESAFGLFVLPLLLALVGLASVADPRPLAAGQSPRFWSAIHGGIMLVGTLTVCVGFLAGLMYVVQSRRLKRKRPPSARFRLPSLEWLEKVNSRSLGLSALLMAAGFLSGLLLSWSQHRTDSSYVLWSDPVVLSLAAMLIWLVIAELFRLAYPSARRGRKVAYLTLATFLFLVFTLLAMTRLDTIHGQPLVPGTTSAERKVAR